MDTTRDGLVRTVIVGCGVFGRVHIRRMLQQQDTTHITALCEPSPQAHAATIQLFEEAGLEAPPNEPDLGRLLAEYHGRLDAALINTPHVFHHDQTKACLEASLDVLVEKPMVMNAAEALSLIETRDRTGRLLVVAFPGSLSPAVRTATRMIRSGELGELVSISAVVWQGWVTGSQDTWRQVPELSGGGFLFDTGAHVLNTVCDLAGEDVVEVAAWLDNRGRSVEIVGVVMGRLASGPLVTIHGCGDTIPSCASDLRVFCTRGILRTDMWGRSLHLQRHGRKHFRKVSLPAWERAWTYFVAIRDGRMENCSPPEVGLRMARLWDGIRVSAARGGVPVKTG